MSRWLEDRRLAPSELTTARTGEFLEVRGQTHRSLYSIKALSPGLKFLRRAGAVPGVRAVADEDSTVEAIERQFRNYLLVERGLTEVSAETYVLRARPFLVDRARRGRLDLELLTAADVSGFVAGWLPGLSTASARSTVTALRFVAVVPSCHGCGCQTAGPGRPDGGVVEIGWAPDRTDSCPGAGSAGCL